MGQYSTDANLFIRQIAWYLTHPSFIPHMVDRIVRRFDRRNRLSYTTKEALAWCQARSVPVSEAVRRVTGAEPGPAFEQAFPELWQEMRERQASIDYTEHGGSSVDLLYQLLELSGANDVLETGVGHGWSSGIVLGVLDRRGRGRLVSVDMPGMRANSHERVGFVVPKRLWSRWELIRMPDQLGLPKALRSMPRPELMHYDSDKTYLGRLRAYPPMWAALVEGGLFISDDVDDNIGFRDFCDSIGREPVIAEIPEEPGVSVRKFVGVLKK